jgi:hypothetical protein
MVIRSLMIGEILEIAAVGVHDKDVLIRFSFLKKTLCEYESDSLPVWRILRFGDISQLVEIRQCKCTLLPLER